MRSQAKISFPGAAAQEHVHDLLERHARTLAPETLGLGEDPYAPADIALRFPMALGLYIRGLVDCPQEAVPSRLDLARAGIAHLLQSRSNPGVWGLPFEWKGFPPGTPMTITTAIAAAGLLAASRHKVINSDADVLRAADWLANGIPWTAVGDGACPWFAEGWPILVNNVAGKVGGLLMEAGLQFDRSDYVERALAAARFVCAQQRPSGAWTYGQEDERSPRSTHAVDGTHMAYALEGLLQILDARDAVPPSLAGRVTESITRGLGFVNRYLCGKHGLREKVWILSRRELVAMHERARTTRSWPHAREKNGNYVVVHPEEPRLWSLGALLTLDALIRHDRVSGGLDASAIVSTLAQLCTDDGRFRYRRGDDHVFVRHEAHVFAGLVDAANIAVQS